jgi:DNA-binding MarR family transcriptional regulator
MKKIDSKKGLLKKSEWTFLSNHAHIILCLFRDPELRVRDIAFQVGITERAVLKIIEDLEGNGILIVSKNGRRNKYKIKESSPLRHDLESHKTVGDLLKLLK